MSAGARDGEGGSVLFEPSKSGWALAREIDEASPAPGSAAVWWLGQSGFLLKTSEGGRLLIDPYLSDHLTRKYAGTSRPHVRMTRNPIAPGMLGGIDAVLCSHRHSDHMDPETLGALTRGNRGLIVAHPAATTGHLASMDLAPDARLVPMDDGDRFEAGGFRVEAIPSAHETLERDDRGRFTHLGFLIEGGGVRFHHSGDTVVYEGLADRLRRFGPDVMFLPINGRDPSRGVPGNMTAEEAVELAASVGPLAVVPHHFRMFTFNTVEPEVFLEAASRLPSGIEAAILEPGARRDFRGRSSRA